MDDIYGSGEAAAQDAPRKQREEGSIAAIFTSLSGEAAHALPDRFATLKKEIWSEKLVETWREVLAELAIATEEISAQGEAVSSFTPSFCAQHLTRLFLEYSASGVCRYSERFVTRTNSGGQTNGDYHHHWRYSEGRTRWSMTLTYLSHHSPTCP